MDVKLKRRVAELLASFALFSGGCSLFFGNIKAPEVKSTQYEIIDLSQADSNWLRSDKTPSEGEGQNRDSASSDVAFQSKTTGSMISLTSACKNYGKQDTPKSLEELTRELLLGISDLSVKEQTKEPLLGYPSLKTQVQGTMGGEKVLLKTQVLRKENCVYDFVYIARPDAFELNERDFSRFVLSFKLK